MAKLAKVAKIVGFGEAMIRLAPPNHQRIEQACSFDIEVGGAELNTLVGLARLGHETEWVSRLQDNSLGQLVLNRVREMGVGTTYVQMVDEGRQGICFFEFGAQPRASEVLYDRKSSSISLANVGSFDWYSILNGADWFHTTGITAALSDSTAAVTQLAINTAKQNKVRISFDINYRSKLWSVEKAKSTIQRLMHGVDVAFVTQSDAKAFFEFVSTDFTSDEQHIATLLLNNYSIKANFCTQRREHGQNRGEMTGSCFVDGQIVTSPTIAFDVIDRIGAGDAFASGVIHGMLSKDYQLAVNFGAAMAALKHTIPGDLPLINLQEIKNVLTGNGKTTGVNR